MDPFIIDLEKVKCFLSCDLECICLNWLCVGFFIERVKQFLKRLICTALWSGVQPFCVDFWFLLFSIIYCLFFCFYLISFYFPICFLCFLFFQFPFFLFPIYYSFFYLNFFSILFFLVFFSILYFYFFSFLFPFTL